MRFLAILLFFPFPVNAAQNKAAVSCEARIMAAREEIGAELQMAEKQNAILEEKVKSLEDMIMMLKGEKRFISSEGYGKAKWGMDQKEVLALYPSNEVSPGSIKVGETIANIAATVEFRFSQNDQLYSVQVEFEGNDLFAHNQRFINVRKYLVDKYGKAATGFVGGGKTQMEEEVKQANWDTGKTRISHILITKVSSLKHLITYTSEELETAN